MKGLERGLLLLVGLAGCSALRVPVRSVPARSVALRMQLAQPPDRTDPEVFPKGPDGKTLITLASLDDSGMAMIDMALAQRNKERILSGEPKYENVDAMIDSYVEYEGRAKEMSRAQCEDAVLRFLQRRALLMEGGADLSDPQTVVTFALLAAIVLGAGYNIAVNGLPQ
jgi:hypothetical protein